MDEKMRLFFFLLAFSLLLGIHSVTAWGKTGHEMVANLAYTRLSKEAQRAVVSILGNENDTFGSPLAAVADWADRVRYTSAYHWTTPLHFIDVHDTEIPGGCPVHGPHNNMTLCLFDYERDCQNDTCVAGAIANYSNSMMRTTNSNLRGDSWRIKESLMFVTHFVGDIHQPLHSARKSDKGGNTFHVHFNAAAKKALFGHQKVEWNLHSVWDDGIIDRALVELYNSSRREFEDDLMAYIEKAANTGELDIWLNCADGRNKMCTSQWAAESLNEALVWAYRNTDDTEVVEGSNLSSDYYNTRLEVVQRRIAAAGVRLAFTLETILEKRNMASFGELIFAFIFQAQS
jgi:hypothetical protein